MDLTYLIKKIQIIWAIWPTVESCMLEQALIFLSYLFFTFLFIFFTFKFFIFTFLLLIYEIICNF